MNKLNILTNTKKSFIEQSEENKKVDPDKILCKYCQRTRTNGIRCMGICVSDNEY